MDPAGSASTRMVQVVFRSRLAGGRRRRFRLPGRPQRGGDSTGFPLRDWGEEFFNHRLHRFHRWGLGVRRAALSSKTLSDGGRPTGVTSGTKTWIVDTAKTLFKSVSICEICG